ncbi:alpha-glucan family phosphorylase [Rhodococcus fascians]|uniref:alpha-glucan family phosphorylase n=1 Tax=Rhodococcoides fascians TaxID=1828 RepID=UPI00050D03E1|nr:MULTISPECIES: alpha-glucan family phosphorylase [Rhodococcus]MBJ7322098.1 alpha-glucan family phosphorylase [Rhodococcus sp. (in: high G+C Gram-positive bacteria)]MBY3792955.1 alpha-glucan family phosphorylase [Rhodococcus fascians]MBY3825712.1 alpha-glucan family phosphorylase [Rhodococcus fascians]MBY3836174.1 alpha-glucan family phosphorylase [Rhodococcus fascians]MBY3866418.1 alpha-glucan family phosphorylase [Rhodococcus fascians]
MKALRRFTVRAHLPARLNALAELSTNLRWSWHSATQDLFEHIDPLLWTELERDPVAVLGAVAPGRLEELAEDASFLAELDAAEADLHDYLARPLWYQNELAEGRALPSGIGYFSMEFGVTEVLPNYSGGLGILAGDHLKAASDLGLPLIGVGLLYRSGYFRQSLTADGWQAERYPSLDPHGLPLRLLTDDNDSPVLIHVSMPGSRVLRARVWIAQVGRVPLLLLDSDIADNDPELRGVTDRLYGGDQDHRIKQEILAGIGGVRAIRAYTRAHGLPDPEVFHMNEGHAGFLGVERIRELVTGSGLDFDSALAAVRAGTVFTTHTPVPAGIDRFPADLVRHYFGGSDGAPDSALLPGLPMSRILALGGESDPSVFNMAHMGLRLGQRANGVSKLHGIVSREMFNGLWQGFDASEVPIGSVTNGVHAPTWAAREWAEGEAETGGPLSSEQVWSTRNALRAQLVDEVRRRVRRSALERGSTEAEISWTANVFDPDVLTVGFARRVPTYKRLTLMLREPERLRAMLLDPVRPVQLVVAGKSHPADDGGKALIQQIVKFADEADVRHRIVFLPDYDMSMARFLYWGCDVWLNNPLRPLEACGTSGMKSALNGGLNLSIRDGWWDEMYDGENGWAIPTADGITDDNRRDDLEAAALYELLEQAVLPKFYDRGEDGVPARWIEMVRHTLEQLGPKVLASRMVQDYTLGYYAPAAHSARAVSADGYHGAKDVASYRGRVEQAWRNVKVTRVDSEGLPDTPVIGAELSLRAIVDLGGMEPGAVVVQAVVGRVDEGEDLSDIRTTEMSHVGSEGGEHVYAGETRLPHSGAVGYTVRVLPRHHGLASDAELGLVSTP